MAAACLAPTAVRAGSVEDARKLLQAKQYDKIDEVLGKDLETASPPAEALRISLAAAVARGRVITAQRRVTALLKAAGQDDLDLVYQGAMISEQAGERRLALSRYLVYVRKQTDKPDRMRHALEYLVTRGKFPGAYKQYVQIFGRNDRAWNMGLALLKRLVVDRETTMALDVGAFMAESFTPTPAQTYALGRFLVNAADRGYLGTEPRKRYIVPLQIMARRRPGRYDQLARMCELAHRYLSGPEAAEVLLAIHAAAKGPVDTRCLALLDRLRYAREGSDPLALSRRVYEAIEPLYRNSAGAGDYARFIDQVCRYRDSFVTAGKTIFDAQTLSALLAEAAKKGAAAQVSLALDRLVGRNLVLRTALAREYAGLIAPDKASWIVGKLTGSGEERAKRIAETGPLVKAFLKGRDVRGTVLAGAALMEWYNQTGEKDALLAAARDYMAAYPGTFEWQWIWQRVWRSKLATTKEKVALLGGQFGKSGQCEPMNQIIIRRIARDGNMRKDRDVQGMIRAYTRRPKGSDAVMRLAVWTAETARGRRRGGPDRAITEALRAYGKAVPASADAAANITEIALLDALTRLAAQSGNPAQYLLRTPLGDKLTPGPIMALMVDRSASANLPALVAKLAPRLTGRDASTMKIWWVLSFAKNARGDEESLFAPYYAQMGWDNAARYILGQGGTWYRRSWRRQQWGRVNWSRQAFMDEIEKLVAMEGFAFGDRWVRDEIRYSVLQRSGRARAADVAPSEALAEAMWLGCLNDETIDEQRRPEIEASVFSVYRMAGGEAADDWLARYAKALAARSADQQVRAVGVLMRSVGTRRVMMEKGLGAYLRLFTLAAAAYEKMSDEQWRSVGVQEEIRSAANMLANNTPWRKALKGDGALLAAGEKLTATFDRRLLAGARWVGGRSPVPALCDRAVKAASAKRDWPGTIAATSRLAQSLGSRRAADEYRGEITGVARTLEQAGANEILYAFLRRIEQGARLSSAMSKGIAILRARAARDITGLISVSPNDPAYPLHLAAQALLLGSETRAWELSRDKAGLFARSWEGLDADFVQWYVRQLYKQKLYEQTLSITRNILRKESSLDAEIAGSIRLTVGDVRRRQENNDEALEVYRALQRSDRYKNTRAATQARYRQVLLMIATGAYGEAEDELAKMVVSPSIDEQAEAYFLLAKLADEQEEYRKADKYLTKVRARVPDHIEAAFLEGELRAKAPSMLARGEILEIGVVAMETVAVPGRELVFRLQDSNLAITKGSTSIPITVETSTGKDVETVDLVLSGTGKNMFKGTIVAALGKIAPNDGTLQLRGADVVTYRIADEFQKSHDISYRPKMLTVKADGDLSASAGRILTAKEVEQREIERRLALARGEEPPAWATARRKSVRPGSPVYVRVTDLDRDVSAEPDTVTIAVKTTGGDVLDKVILTETGPNTGIFMGEIPTSMPLPKGLASDTFEGKSPAWLINSTVDRVWSSVDDGAKDKWIEADTMTSHLVKRVAVELPDATKITSLRLSGRLSGDEQIPLAVYPLEGQQQGLRLEVFADPAMTRLASERTVGSTVLRAGDLGKGNTGARLSGVIVPPYTGQYTFHVSVRSARARLRVNDKMLIDQWPAKGDGRDASGKIRLLGGREYNISLEFATSSGNPANGECHLSWESKTIGRQNIPYQATYPGPMASRMDDLRHWRTNVAAAADRPLAALAAIRAQVKTGQGGTGFQPVGKQGHSLKGYATVKRTSVSPGRDELGVLAGTFSLPAERMLAVKITAENVGADSRAYLLIDGRQELGGKLSDLAGKATSVFLRRGAHRMELVYRSAGAPLGITRIAVLAGDAEDKFTPLPWQWFSADHSPDLADGVLPNGLITLNGDTFTATLRKPIRLRSVRWHFTDFTGKDVAARRIHVTSAEGNRVIPVARDFTSSLTNDVLEIAPGDRISMVYIDEKNLQGESGSRKAGLGLERGAGLSVSFDDGEISLAHEEKRKDADGNETTELFTARRCSADDVLIIMVSDEDIDQTPRRDKVRVTVTTSSGKKIALDILERQSLDKDGKPHEVCHTGEFVTRIRLVAPGPAKPAPKAPPAKAANKVEPDVDPTIEVAPGDEIVVRYVDAENNDGVPMDRIYRLTEGGAGLGGWTVLRTRTRLVEETSSGGIILRDDLRRISGDPEMKLYRQEVLHLVPASASAASEPSGAAGELAVEGGLDAAGLPICSVRGQMRFSLLYPRLARNMGSTIRIVAVAESEIKAAKAEKRSPKGAIVTMDLPDEDELEAGRFHAVLDLQIGVPGDKLSLDAAAAAAGLDQPVIKTIIVRGDDVVQLRFRDPATDKPAVQRVRMLADGRLEVLERTYRAQRLKIHLGQRFHVRVADPDKDVTDKRDTVTVALQCSSGGKIDLKLTETLVHSGVFTGSIEPRWGKLRGRDEGAVKAAVAAVDKALRNQAAAQVALQEALTRAAAAKRAAEAAAAKAAAARTAARKPATKAAAETEAANAAASTAATAKTAADQAAKDAAVARANAKAAADYAATAEPAAKPAADAAAAKAADDVPARQADADHAAERVATARVAAEQAAANAAAATAAANAAADKAAAARTAARKAAAEKIAADKGVTKATAAKAAADRAVVQGKQAKTVATAPREVLYADFGDTVGFAYVDDKPVSTAEALKVRAQGAIVRGTDGNVALFSKKYKDPEMAVKVSFLTAESLFYMGKDLRAKGRKPLANEYIARGKSILEQALRNYPDTSLVAQGEFLVATLAQELGRYTEARGKYSEVIQRWTKSPYAAKALYAIAQCYEAQKNYERAINEYVRVTYLFPDSPEVTRATLRIGNHYLREARLAAKAENADQAARNHAVAGRILEKFHEKHPRHARASAALFLAGECYRLCEKYTDAIVVFTRVAKQYRDNKTIRAEALYWKGVCAREIKDYVMAYRSLKRLTWDYPESEQAANARRLISGDEFADQRDDRESGE